MGNIKEGEQPACVASCPLRAIEVGRLADFENRHDVTISIRHIHPLILPILLPGIRF